MRMIDTKQKYQNRLDEYLNILDKVPAVKKSVLDSFSYFKNNQGEEMPFENRLYLVAIAVPLISFTEWVIEEALKKNKNRIYFLSRDGYQLYLIAEKIVEAKGINIECRYLNVSRLSMRIPSYKLNIEKSIDSICVGGIDVNKHKILKRGGLTDEECRDVLNELELESDEFRILNYKEVIEFKKRLSESSIIKKYLEKYSSNAYENAIGYLKQEGLLEDSRFAIVDSGWIGTLQRSIQRLIKSVRPDIEVDGYYFGLYNCPRKESGIFNAFYFTPLSGLERKSRFSNSLFETIVSSEEATTIGYGFKDGIYIPLFNEIVNPNAKTINSNIAALKILLDCFDFENSADRKTIEKLFDLFMAKPSEAEVKSYGDNLFSDDVNDGCFKKVADDLSLEDIRNQRFINKLIIILGIKKAVIRESSWIEGSALKAYNYTSDVLKEYRHIRKYKYFVFARKQTERMIGIKNV